MDKPVTNDHRLTNLQIADALAEIGELLEREGTSPFRVGAYRRAARVVRQCPRQLDDLFNQEGIAGLQQLPGVGDSLSKKIAQLLRKGQLRALDRLRRRRAEDDWLTTLPGVGPTLAGRIRHDLGSQSLEDVFGAAYDGRLRRVDGLGRKRVQAIRESLAQRLKKRPARPLRRRGDEPSVATLLEIDRVYHNQAARERLPLARLRTASSAGPRWLPILRTQRHGRNFCAHFAVSRRAAVTATTIVAETARDSVVVYCSEKRHWGLWTIETAVGGPLGSQRVVRGREEECLAHYGHGKLVQRLLPTTETANAGPANRQPAASEPAAGD